MFSYKLKSVNGVISLIVLNFRNAIRRAKGSKQAKEMIFFLNPPHISGHCFSFFLSLAYFLEDHQLHPSTRKLYTELHSVSINIVRMISMNSLG
jgi:hypothetical protein